MLNFSYVNPVKVVFGKGQISRLRELIPMNAKILITYGGGSIKKNGVYTQVKDALAGHHWLEFGGIEPNPKYETCMQVVEMVKREKIDFLLSVGGGSVLDGTKFIAAAAKYEGGEPWDILEKGAEVKDAVKIGCVMTLPATGSESNSLAVISRNSTQQKLAYYSEKSFPQFCILDPETTMSLSERQVANGIVDTFVHVSEQYMTYPVNTPLQDRMAEGIYLTLIEETPKVKADPMNYEVRANLMWCATWGLNGWIAQGCVQDWLTHMIGHEITALTGTDHGRTLALVLPAVWSYLRESKKEKLLQYAQRIWGITGNDSNQVIDEAISRTKAFFRQAGITATKAEYGVTDEVCRKIAEIAETRNPRWGERQNITGKDVLAILDLCD
ncbi:MAG: iron-containing alcohol dehydrogenase [Planctomycetia bacterium]|nr:iron-containing alcohol dehydrogenase [Planctomycetia bacterium]